MEQHTEKIFSFYRRTKRMPSYSEIMTLTGLKSKNSVFRLVQKLVAEGVLDKDSQGYLVPLRHPLSLPLLGTVAAGFPSAAEEESQDALSLDEYLINNKEATYLLKVQGDSMIDAGIMEGDMVLVERGVTARTGDIVIAEVDHEWTMKYLKKDRRGQVVLIPANKKYPPIYPTSELNIAAVVRAVVRKY